MNEKQKAKIIIISHLGRPKGSKVSELSLIPVYKFLKEQLKKLPKQKIASKSLRNFGLSILVKNRVYSLKLPNSIVLILIFLLIRLFRYATFFKVVAVLHFFNFISVTLGGQPFGFRRPYWFLNLPTTFLYKISCVV